MKKYVMICCMLLLVLMLLPVTAQADVIYEPFDDFYFSHRGECEYVNRAFTAAGPNGTVTLYVDPLNPAQEKTYPNGTVFTVSYTYESAKGIQWGCCDMWEDGVTGWAPMEYLELIYDGRSFEEEFGDKFVPVYESLDASLLTEQTICFWQYPGSEVTITVEAGEDYLLELYNIYTDDHGNRWGQCGYYFGIKNYWINLDDPSAEPEMVQPTEQEETSPETRPVPSAEPVEEIKPAGDSVITVLVIAVASVMAVTAVLLILLKKKRA